MQSGPSMHCPDMVNTRVRWKDELYSIGPTYCRECEHEHVSHILTRDSEVAKGM
jgi:hypothetical protein